MPTPTSPTLDTSSRRRTAGLSLAAAVAAVLAGQSAQATTIFWDGGGVGGTDLGTATNWDGDILPDVSIPDTALWNGNVAGPLSLVYSDAAFAGVAGNTGLNFSIGGTQTDSLNLDSGANTSSFRINDVTIDAGAGAFSLGNSLNVFNLTLGGVAGQTHTWTNNSSNTATVASDVVFGLGGGGVHTLALAGSGNWALNNVMGNGTGTFGLTKSGNGTLTLAGVNTYTGGVVHNAGTLNINNAAALGNTATGALTINGGTIDNTSGVAVTTTTAKAQNWNGDFTFTGSNNLSFNLGAVVIGGTAGPRTVTVTNGTLSTGLVFSPIGSGLTKSGTGTLTLANTANTTNIGGPLNLNGGLFQMFGDVTAGGLTGSGTIENGTLGKWLFIRNFEDNTFSGTIRNGATAGQTLGLNKGGTGTLTLSGTTTYTNQTTVAGGTIEFGTTGLTGSSRSVGNLVFANGDGAVKSSSDGTGTASLTFITSEGRTAGATGNFIIAGGTNGTTNRINLTKAAGFLDQGTFFNGSQYAWMDGVNTFVRAINYATDGVTVATSGTTASLPSIAHQEFTGDITAQTDATFTTLKDAGNNAFTLAGGATVTTNGILKTGNVAGGATISGGVGIRAASGAELVIRVDGVNDALTINTPIIANGANALTTSGAGTLTLGGANTYTGTTFVNSRLALNGSILGGAVNILGGGTFDLGGSMTTGAIAISGGGTMNLAATGVVNSANANNGQVTVGNATGGNAVLNINGGTLRAGKTSSPSIAVANAANSSGFIRMTSGTLTTGSEFHIGNGAGAAGANPYAAFTMSGGTVTSANWFVVGLNNDRAVFNQSGGTVTVNANRGTFGAGGNGSVGVLNLSGGTFTVAAGANTGIFLGENGIATLTLSGSAGMTLNTNSGTNSGTMQFGGNASSLGGNFNLNGGTLTAFGVTKGASTTTAVNRFNFNGGTLKANATNAAFFASLANTTATVYGGGGTIDNSGFNITLAQPLLAATSNGINGITSFTGGAGYLDTPVVTVVRGAGDTTGVGATAVANVSGGVVTGITMTNPGTGYTATPTFTIYGGGATTPATITGAAPTANTSGGLTFTGSGSGVTTLTGVNTYTGATSVTGGNLTLGGAGEINASSGITVNGAGAKLVQASTVTVVPAVTVTNGTLDGTGVVNTATVADSATTAVANGNGTTNAFTINSLTFNGSSTLNLFTSSTSPVLLTTNLNTRAVNTAGVVTVNATNATWLPGQYDLVLYSTLNMATGTFANNFVKGTINGLSGRQTATLINPTNFISLVIAGDNPVWTGLVDGSWTTAAIASPKNWKLIAGGTETDFLTNDVVLFDDTATGTNLVNISTANVSPLGTVFNNSAFDYTISSTGGFGIATGSITKNGNSAVNLNNANTYTGGTTVNAGTLNINNASAIGLGALTLNAFSTIDNTSGGAITLSTNNAQNWSGDFTYFGSNDLNLGTGAVTLNADRTVTTIGAGTLTVGGTVGGGFGLTKAGAGKLVLAGAYTTTGNLLVNDGELLITGTTTESNAANPIKVADGGSFTATLTVGAGGTLAATTGEIWVGNNSGANATLNLLSGGTINVGNWFAVGRNSATGTFNISGGTLNKTTAGGNITLAGIGTAQTGTIEQTGGTINNTLSQTIIGETGIGIYNISGVGSLGNLGPITMGFSATSNGTVNLNGGTIATTQVTKTNAAATATFNFNGGLLKANTGANAAFMTGLTAANVRDGGARIDTNGLNITIGQALQHSTIGGDAAIDGGLTKSGNGVLTLSGANTYTGATLVSAGTLTLDATGSINGSSGITINGSGAKMIQANTTTAVSPAVTLTTGTLDGTGTLGTVTVGDGTGGVVANGNGSANSLTIGSLTFNGTATMNLNTTSTSPVVLTTTLTSGAVNAAGLVTINANNVSWTTGQVYNLISYSTLSGVGFSDFLKGTVTGLGARQTATLTNPAGFISLSIAGDTAVWTGGFSTDWTTTTITAPKNWKLQATLATTDFVPNDAVLFDDTAVSATPVNVNIADANVTPASVTFNNSTKDYSVASAGGFVIASGSLTKNGTGTVTINTANTYTGGTVVNNGTLNLSGNNAFGAGGVTVTGGTATLSGTNSYTGGTSVTGGTLVMAGNNTFGVGSVTVSGGTATLSGVNTYTGVTTLSGGTLNINNAGALGSAALVITGGSVGNTSGGDILMTAAKAQSWNGDFSFTGPNNLDFNLGAVTLGGAVGTRTVTVTAGTLSTGLINGAAGYNLTKSGAGILAMTNTANTSAVLGELSITGGTVRVSGDFTMNGLTGSGTIENGGAASKWLFVNNAVDNTFSGTIQSNPGNAAARLGLVKRGVGTLNLTGANNTYTDNFNIENGKVRLTGINTTGDGTAGQASIGSIANQNGVLVIDGGTLNANKTSAPSISAGTAATSSGAIIVNAGGTLNAPGELWLGNPAGGYGALTLNAGSVTSGSWLPVARSGSGVLNVNGGTLAVTSQNISIASFGGAVGVATLTGGTTSVTSVADQQGIVIVGEGGTGYLTVSGTAALNAAGALGVQLGRNGGTGTVNLNGGTVTTTTVTKGSGTGTLNFNGGKVVASAANPTFLQGLTNTYVYGGGGTIDDGGFTITVAQDLLAPTGSGVSATGVAVSGGGYIGAPIVQVGGDGVGATAIANIDSNGNLTGITVTNPGVDYTSAFFTLVGGGFGNTGSVDSGPTVAANTSGTLTKAGSGTVNLTGVQGYATLRTTAGTTNISGTFTNANATVNANATTNFETSQTLAALNIGTVALADMVQAPALDGSALAAGTAVVPEPGSLGLLVVGALGLFGRRRRAR